MEPEIGVPAASGSNKGTTSEDDLKFLRAEDGAPKVGEDEEESSEEEPEEETEEAGEETEESEEEDEEKSDDESEEEEPEEPAGSLITARDLKGKYPDIFKKFPELRSVIYREQQYSTIFVDPKEAQQAAQYADSFKEIESDLVSGNPKPLITAIKGIKEAKFNDFAAALLPALKEVDEQTYMKVLAVPFKILLRSAVAYGEKRGDKNLQLSAQHLHNFIFENLDIDDKAEFEKEEKDKTNPEEEKYKKKLEEIDERDRRSFKVEVDRQWMDGVRTSFFDKFDPDGTFTKWAKDKMFEDCIMQLNEQFGADARFKKSIDNLWVQAKASGYNADSKSRIVTAALARARQIIPQLRSKIRAEALAKEKRDDNKKSFKVAKREDRQPKREKPSSRDTSKMTDLDIIRG